MRQQPRREVVAGDFGDRTVELSLQLLASEHVDRLPALRPDLAPGDDAILTSIVQFDLLSILTAIADRRSVDTRVFYTNFARFNWQRSEPALLRLLSDREMRQTLFPLDDEDLATAIATVSRLASNESYRFSGFPGWENERIMNFVAEHLPRDDEADSSYFKTLALKTAAERASAAWASGRCDVNAGPSRRRRRSSGR